MMQHCAFLFLICLFQYGHSSYSDTRQLFHTISSNCTKDIRPRVNQSDRVTVTVTSVLRSIVDYDVANSRLTLGLSFSLHWQDEIMAWDGTNFENVPYVWISPDKIWIPNIFVYTTLSENNRLISNTDSNLPELVLYRNGLVNVVIVKVIDILCEPYIEKYPYDEHACYFVLSTDRGFNDVSLLPSSTKGLLISYLINNTRWEFVSSSAYSSHAHGLSSVSYSLILRRYRRFLTLNMIVPVAILSIINPLVFVLPIESGERVSYSITIFLSFIVFLSSLADDLPEVNNPISIYNIFLIVQLLYSAMIIVMVNIISWLDHRTTETGRVCSCFCSNNSTEKTGGENSEDGSARKSRNVSMINTASFVIFVTFSIVEYVVIVILLT